MTESVHFLLHSSGFGQAFNNAQRNVPEAGSLHCLCPFRRTPVFSLLTVHSSAKDDSLRCPSCTIHKGYWVARRRHHCLIVRTAHIFLEAHVCKPQHNMSVHGHDVSAMGIETGWSSLLKPITSVRKLASVIALLPRFP